MSNRFVLGIVSHGHNDFIDKNTELEKIAKKDNVSVVVKDNLKDKSLESIVQNKRYHYISSDNKKGFGENNNDIYDYAKTHLGMDSEDWFIILNPDVTIEIEEFEKLVSKLSSAERDFFTPNLYKDSKYTQAENSIREFTKISNLLNPFALKPVNIPINKNAINDGDIVDWASGAFLCVRNKAFEKVGGFDVNYFMYYEDVDLCYRLKQAGVSLRFIKDVRAVHKGEYKNRTIFSKHFLWYLTSLARFLFSKKNGNFLNLLKKS
jgi:GT2 family glycosyltransferase